MPISTMAGQLFAPLTADQQKRGACRDRRTGDDALIHRYSPAASGWAAAPSNLRLPVREDVYECVIVKRTPKSHHQEGDVVMLTNPI